MARLNFKRLMVDFSEHQTFYLFTEPVRDYAIEICEDVPNIVNLASLILSVRRFKQPLSERIFCNFAPLYSFFNVSIIIYWFCLKFSRFFKLLLEY